MQMVKGDPITIYPLSIYVVSYKHFKESCNAATRGLATANKIHDKGNNLHTVDENRKVKRNI